MIRVVHDYTFGLLAVPSIYIALFLLFAYLFKAAYQSISQKNILVFLSSLIKSVLFLLFCFYVLWGFNYFKPDFRKLANLELDEIPGFDIDHSFRLQSEKLNSYDRKELDYELFDARKHEDKIRVILEDLLQEWGIPTIGRVRVRKLPKGSLLHLRTSGIYIPHAIEGHFDGGLYQIQWPFTMAHEMAHGYGLTDEAVCNYIAYRVCQNADIKELQYSSDLAYWRYLAANVNSDSIVRLNKGLLDTFILNDIKEIRTHILSYKEWMPKSRDVIYDQYLKSHRVKAGIKSYDQMIALVETWKYLKMKEQKNQDED